MPEFLVGLHGEKWLISVPDFKEFFGAFKSF